MATTTQETQFPVGTQYISHGKWPRLCTVIDVHTTRNAAGDIVKIRYVATHKVWEQVITDSDVTHTSVKMGIARREKLRQTEARNSA